MATDSRLILRYFGALCQAASRAHGSTPSAKVFSSLPAAARHAASDKPSSQRGDGVTRLFGSGLRSLLNEASNAVPSLAVTQALPMINRHDVVFVDVREPVEVAKSGKIQGALAVPRGVLEFTADPDSPFHHAAFSDRSRQYVLYCDSGSRSRLAGQTLRAMGFPRVATLSGYHDWVSAKAPVEHIKILAPSSEAVYEALAAHRVRAYDSSDSTSARRSDEGPRLMHASA